MSTILPRTTDTQDGATVLEFPAPCREYLGETWGWCPGRAEAGDTFCARHRAERDRYDGRLLRTAR